MNDPPGLPTASTADPSAAPADVTTRAEPDSPAAATQSELDLPTDVAGYRLLGEIARGGMGAVYRAHDLAFNRSVAVKVLQERYGRSPAAAARFLEEARITAQLQHPGIPPVHHVGTLPDGRPFLAMKLIRGRTLADLIADPAWDRGQAVGTFEQVCHTVAYAHEHGVIHRDLKPQNVMVGRFNEVQVMDWGLAKVRTARRDEAPETRATTTVHDPREAEGDDLGTRAGSVLGTPAYMPPEQAIGAVDQVDERSDVFGLGAILCAVLTGKPPYVGTDSESTRQLAARARLDEAHARLAATGADPALVGLCRRCLSPEPLDRPADAGEVARAVAGLRAAADERARQAELDRVRSEGERAKAEAEAREQRKRRRAQLASGAAVGTLLLGVAAVVWDADRRATQRRAEAEAQASHLLVRCEQALREDDVVTADAVLNDPRLGEVTNDELARRAEQCRRDLTLFRELERIDQFRWTPAHNQFPDASVVAERWRAALAAYGIESAGPDERAMVETATVRERLLAVFDAWLAVEPSEWVRDLLARTDPDEFRNAVRDALAARDEARVAALAGEAAALAQPARFAAALGQVRFLPVERRRKLLEAGLRDRPGDLALLMELGDSYPLDRRDGANERVRWFQAAVAAHPRDFAAFNNLGTALAQLNDPTGAEEAYRHAIRLDPASGKVHGNLGAVLLAQKKIPESAAESQEALRLDPSVAEAHYNLGLALKSLNDPAGALAEFRRATYLNSDDRMAVLNFRMNREMTVNTLGGLEGVAAAYQTAARTSPTDARAHGNLAWLLATGPNRLRDGAGAVRHATRACELAGWKDPVDIEVLAAAHAAAGDFDRAVEYQQKALSVPGYARQMGPSVRDRVDLYRRKMPYYDPELFRSERGPAPRVVKK